MILKDFQGSRSFFDDPIWFGRVAGIPDDFAVFDGIWRILGDPGGFLVGSEEFGGFLEDSSVFGGFRWILQDSGGFLQISADSGGFEGLARTLYIVILGTLCSHTGHRPRQILAWFW